jgi:DNA-binding transcriptional regulator YdaS (Cro superfamily)
MNARQYRDAIERLGLNQTTMARLLGIDARTSRRYALGECNVPPHTARVIEFELERTTPNKGRPVRK